MRSGVVAGSKVSNSTSRMPVMRLAVSMVSPPMCDIGTANGFTSRSVALTAWIGPDAPCITVRSVCLTAFGSAVVPDDV